jgi:hypothetical protein
MVVINQHSNGASTVMSRLRVRKAAFAGKLMARKHLKIVRPARSGKDPNNVYGITDVT